MPAPETVAPPAESSATRVRWRTVAVFAWALAAYAGAVPSDFVFDDVPVVLGNPVVMGRVPLRQLFSRDWWGFGPAQTIGTYRPVADLALWCDWHLTHRAWAMHLTNVLLHAVAMALIYRVLRRLVPETTALVAALFCAVFAAPSEAVQAVVGRADLLEILGVVGGLALHRRVGWRWGAGATGAFALALGSKESALMAVALWAALDLTLPDSDQPWRRRLGRYAGYAAVFAGYLVLRRKATGLWGLPQTTHELYNPLSVAGTSGRIFGAGHIFFERYLAGMIDPTRRLYDCSKHACDSSNPQDPLAWIGLGLFAVILVLPLLLWRRSPVATAGVVWFLCFFAPVSNIFVPATLAYGERLLYLPAVGLGVALAEAARVSSLRLRRPELVWAGFAAVIAINAVALQLRHLDWRSNETLYRSGLRYASESAVVLQGNAGISNEHGEYADAEQFARRALSIVPDDEYAHEVLAVALSHEDRLAEAEVEFRRSLRDRPRPEIVAVFASFLASNKRYADALTEVRLELARHPDDSRLKELEIRLLHAVATTDAKVAP